MMAMSEKRDEDRPESLGTAVLSIALGILAFAAFSAAAGTVGAVLFDPRINHPVNGLTWAFLALFLLIGGIAAWGLARLKPWVRREPISPSSRRAANLFALSGVVMMPGALALYLGSMRADNPNALFSNSPIALWIAIFATVSWLLGMAIGWWWYFISDEHERKAYDFGTLVGAGLFCTVTPVWWVAARAGLLPQPNAMVLWSIMMVIISIGWFWRRYR